MNVVIETRHCRARRVGRAKAGPYALRRGSGSRTRRRGNLAPV